MSPLLGLAALHGATNTCAPFAKWNAACIPRGNGTKDPKTYGVRNCNSDGRSGLCHAGSLSDAPAVDSPVLKVTEPTGEEDTFLTHANRGEGAEPRSGHTQSVFEGGPRHHHASRPLRELKGPLRPQT